MDPRGEWLDWYAPFAGLVTPWAAAGENERDVALQQLETLYQTFDDIAENIEKAANAPHDQRLFARMLRKARQFPGSGQVFLVDGKPVITFWGFTRTGRERADPLQCLREAPAAALPPLRVYAPPIPEHDDAAPDPLSPAAAAGNSPQKTLERDVLPDSSASPPSDSFPSAVAAEVPLPPAPKAEQGVASPPQPAWTSASVITRGVRWRKLLWIPLLLLLFTALWFALRTYEQPDQQEDGARLAALDQKDTDDDRQAANNGGVQVNPQPNPTNNGGFPTNPQPHPANNGGFPTNPQPNPANNGGFQTSPQQPNSANNGGFQLNKQNPQPPQTGVFVQSIPDGPWSLRREVQDTQTGLWLRMEYMGQGGTGQLHIERSDGVTCDGPVMARIQNGRPSVYAKEALQCSDGSIYTLPSPSSNP